MIALSPNIRLKVAPSACGQNSGSTNRKEREFLKKKTLTNVVTRIAQEAVITLQLSFKHASLAYGCNLSGLYFCAAYWSWPDEFFQLGGYLPFSRIFCRTGPTTYKFHAARLWSQTLSGYLFNGEDSLLTLLSLGFRYRKGEG